MKWTEVRVFIPSVTLYQYRLNRFENDLGMSLEGVLQSTVIIFDQEAPLIEADVCLEPSTKQIT